jgi:hypothetical protein
MASTPADPFAVFPAWTLTEIPRPSEPDSTSAAGGRHADHGAEQRAQSLSAASCRGAPVAFAWVRARAGGPVQVIAAGPALAGITDAGQAVLTLPAGARGDELAVGHATAILAQVPCWTPLAAVTDALLADTLPGAQRHDGRDLARPSLEEGLLAAWPGPFAWLVLAEPVAAEQIDELVSEVALAQVFAERNDSPRAQLAARRTKARHDDLRRASASGLWTIKLLAGSTTPHDAAQVAGLLTASLDLHGLPYALTPIRRWGTLPDALAGQRLSEIPATDGRRPHPAGSAAPGSRVGDANDPRSSFARDVADAWAAGNAGHHEDIPPQWFPPRPPAPGPRSGVFQDPAAELFADPVPEFPFRGSSRLLAALARPPAREVPGIRFTLRPDFDVTPEPAPSDDDGGVTLGAVLDWNRIPAGTLTVPRASLNRHTFICGATGAGKSQTVRHLLESAAHVGIPWLVIEPAKAEYRLMTARLPGTQVITIRPGDLDVPPAGINPLEPAAGPDGTRFPLQAHGDLLRALFLAAFDADEPFPQVLSAALTRLYTEAGWDLVTGQPANPDSVPGYPSLGDLQAAAMAVVEEIGYGQEVTDNVRGFVQVRIGSLRLGTTGRFLDGAHPLDFAKLLGSNVVLEIEDCGDDRDKAFLTGAVLVRLTEYLRMRHRHEPPGPARLRHLTVVEEAHRLLRQPPPGTGSGPAAHAVEMFADLLAEVRAYGEGIVLAEQIPSKLIPDAVKNTAVKIVHRLPAQDDRDSVGATMNLTAAQSRYLVTLVPGEAAVFTDGMDYPLLVRMPDGTARENSAPAGTATPAVLITPRSPACPPQCAALPCTLRQIRAAQTAVGRDPRIVLWAELSVLAHLTGWEMPMPSEEFAVDLDATDPRERDCALAHAVEDAVAARLPAVSARVSGPAFAAHVAAALRAALDGVDWFCGDREPQWLAPAYQWSVILDDLRDYDRAHPCGGRHPDTSDWETAQRRPIPGATCAEQLAVVQRWDDAAKRDEHELAVVGWGTRPYSAIERAAGVRSGDLDWEQRLIDALAEFPGHRWPADQLSPTLPKA